jgi:hypothetical protein
VTWAYRLLAAWSAMHEIWDMSARWARSGCCADSRISRFARYLAISDLAHYDDTVFRDTMAEGLLRRLPAWRRNSECGLRSPISQATVSNSRGALA